MSAETGHAVNLSIELDGKWVGNFLLIPPIAEHFVRGGKISIELGYDPDQNNIPQAKVSVVEGEKNE